MYFINILANKKKERAIKKNVHKKRKKVKKSNFPKRNMKSVNKI